MKIKITPEMEALIEIKLLINRFYEKRGREEFEDGDELRIDLINDIEEIIEKTKIPDKLLILNRLEIDNVLNQNT